MVHAALLLLMLEAANARPRFTISLKRSTQNLQLSTSWPADYPICLVVNVDFDPSDPCPLCPRWRSIGKETVDQACASRTLQAILAAAARAMRGVPGTHVSRVFEADTVM